jgi:hypothetical protein
MSGPGSGIGEWGRSVYAYVFVYVGPKLGCEAGDKIEGIGGFAPESLAEFRPTSQWG